MGKASKFFKSLLGFRTTEAPAKQSARSEAKQPKRRWSFAKSYRGISQRRLRDTSSSFDGTSLHHYHRNPTDNEDPNEHAIALVAATAAVVDAAVAAAQAAAEVVRITSRSCRTTAYGVREDLAAVKIQSCFRAYLARRALKALKALVKLQAVVRGHILRKQTADMMRRLQALHRAQARARALRSLSTSSHFHHHEPQTPEKIEQFPRNKHDHRSISMKSSSKSYTRDVIAHENDKIVEVDMGQPVITTKGKKLFQHEQINFGSSQSLTTSRGSTVQPTTSRGSTVQPTTSSPCASCEVNSYEGSRSCVSGYSDHPNYMANTESSRAKVRSLSAPRMRGQNEVFNGTKKDLGYKHGSGTQWVPTVSDSFVRKAYPGSGRLDRLGMPIYDMGESEFCVGKHNPKQNKRLIFLPLLNQQKIPVTGLKSPNITTMPPPSPSPSPSTSSSPSPSSKSHKPPPPPPAPPTTGIIKSSYKKGKQTKVFRVVRSVFRSFPIVTPPKISLLPGGRQPEGHRGTHCVTGTLYGYRKGCVALAIQENTKTLPIMILELELETNALQTEMNLGMVRIALECEKQQEKEKVKLLEEPSWTMFFNGKKGGRGVKRDPTEEDYYVMETLSAVAMGNGVLPGKSEVEGPDGEIAYMRAHFDRVVGSKDTETLYILSPDGNNGPELSIFFVRI
ncbi:hypothetical protein LXL04_029639 [Taraxacum kok-saghyz]